MLLHPYVIAMWYGHVIASLCYCNVIWTCYRVLMLLQYDMDMLLRPYVIAM